MTGFIQFIGDSGNLLATLAMALLVLAFLMGSMRALRNVAMLAGLCALLHFFLRAPDSPALVWVVLLVIANGIRLVLMHLRSRSGLMRAEERALVAEVLRVEEPAMQRRLLDVIEWRDAGAGEVLMRQGQLRPPLIYVAGGAADVSVDGNMVGQAEPGDFLGEMSLVSGAGASATVTTSGPMRIARIDRDAVLQLSAAIPELARAFDLALNRTMAAKIARMNAAAAGEGE